MSDLQTRAGPVTAEPCLADDLLRGAEDIAQFIRVRCRVDGNALLRRRHRRPRQKDDSRQSRDLGHASPVIAVNAFPRSRLRPSETASAPDRASATTEPVENGAPGGYRLRLQRTENA